MFPDFSLMDFFQNVLLIENSGNLPLRFPGFFIVDSPHGSFLILSFIYKKLALLNTMVPQFECFSSFFGRIEGTKKTL